MAKPIPAVEVKPKLPVLGPKKISLPELRAMRLPDRDTFFRMKRVEAGWAIDILHADGRRFEVDPWDTIENVERRVSGLVGEAERAR